MTRRAARATLLLAGAALLPGCAEPDRRAALAAARIEARLHLERQDGRAAERFVSGEPVALVLTVRNPGDRSWRLPLATAQSHDFAIGAPDGRELWRWSAGRRFAQQLGELALAPGEERLFRATFTPESVEPVPPGRYRAAGWLGGGRLRGPGAEFEFRIASRD